MRALLASSAIVFALAGVACATDADTEWIVEGEDGKTDGAGAALYGTFNEEGGVYHHPTQLVFKTDGTFIRVNRHIGMSGAVTGRFRQVRDPDTGDRYLQLFSWRGDQTDSQKYTRSGTKLIVHNLMTDGVTIDITFLRETEFFNASCERVEDCTLQKLDPCDTEVAEWSCDSKIEQYTGEDQSLCNAACVAPTTPAMAGDGTKCTYDFKCPGELSCVDINYDPTIKDHRCVDLQAYSACGQGLFCAADTQCFDPIDDCGQLSWGCSGVCLPESFPL